MRYIIHLIKFYPFSTLLIIGIWMICIMPIPDNPLRHVSFADKWTHMALYAVLGCSIWTEYLRKHRKLNRRRLFLLGFIAPLLMGGLIEIVQATCTGGNRSGDWLDFLADSVGVVLAQLIGIPLAMFLSKRKKDS